MAFSFANHDQVLWFLAISLLLIVLQPCTASINDSDPFVASYLKEVCKEVECGKGACKASLNYTYNFICECNNGWTQRRYDNGSYDQFYDHRFLPCIIPNCSLDYSCAQAPPLAAPPMIQEPLKNNISYFDPCTWAYCGDGTCNRSTLRYGHICECKAGFKNLLNISAFPCLSDCEYNNTSFPCLSDCVIGSDCSRLGITVSNDSAVSGPSSAANSISDENVIGSAAAIIGVSLAAALWN